MKGNIVKKISLVLSLSVVLSTGYIYYKQTINEYEPKSERQLRKNQVLFDDESKEQSKTETNKNAKVWEEDKQSITQDSFDVQNQTDYLYKSQSSPKTVSLNHTNQESAGQQSSTAQSNGDSIIYDITDDKNTGKVDTIISEDDDTNAAQKPSHDADTNNPENKPSSLPTAKPDIDQGETDKKTNSTIRLPSSKNNPSQFFPDGSGIGKFEDGQDIGGEEDDAYNENVVISQDGLMMNADSTNLFEGQYINDRDVFNALYTYVKGTDGKIHYWTSQEYGQYIRIDAVSFDSGNTWLDFPVHIPQNLSEGQMKIKVSWRLTSSGKWLERIVDYVPKQVGLYILSENIDDTTEEIDADSVLNYNHYPEIGDSEWLSGSVLSSFFTKNGYIDENDELTKLLANWNEDGNPVDWNYTITGGRHVIVPGDVVDVPDGFHITLNIFWLNDAYEVDPAYDMLTYYQTLSYVDDEAVELVVGEEGTQTLVRVPEYVQAIQMDPFLGNCYDQMFIPKSVMYVDSSTMAPCIYDRFIVDPDNPMYASNDEGVLMNKAQDTIIAIPSKIQTIHVPSTVKKVHFSEATSIEDIYLQATQFDQLPDIDLTKLSNKTIHVDSAVFDEFIDTYHDILQNYHIQVTKIAEDAKLYSVKDGFLVSGKMIYKSFANDESISISNAFASVKQGAFADTETNTIVLPLDGSIVDFDENSLAGSNVSLIICHSSAQKKHIEDNLATCGKSDVEVVLSSTSKEGYQYYVKTDEAGNAYYILLRAKQTPKVYDGTLTVIGQKEPVTIHEICAHAFSENQTVQFVSLPESCVKIGAYAFDGCTNLEGLLINTTDTITIADKALDNNGLRFVGSNAKTGILENGYNPEIDPTALPNRAETNTFFYVPTNANGYASNCTYFVEESGIYSYKVIDNTYLYACNADGTPFLLLRSMHVQGELSLPETTNEIFSYAFSNLDDSFTIDFAKFSSPDLYIDVGAFLQSGIEGDVWFPQQYVLVDDSAFRETNITSVGFENDGQLRERAYSDCHALKQVTINTGTYPILDNLFYDCENLSDLYLNHDSLPSVTLMYLSPFQFNHAWSEEEEVEKLTVHIKNVEEDDYTTLIREWRFAFLGCVDEGTTSAYTTLYNTVSDRLIDFDTMTFPTEEEINAEVYRQLLNVENRIRRLFKIDSVETPVPYAEYTVDAMGMITLHKMRGDVSSLELYGNNLNMPDDWYPDTIDSNAFEECKSLSELYINQSETTLENNVFAGVESPKLTIIPLMGKLYLHLEEEGMPYSFGIADDQVFYLDFTVSGQELFDCWKYALVGYNTKESFASAMHQQLIDSGMDEDSENFASALLALENEKLQEAKTRFLTIYHVPEGYEVDIDATFPEDETVEDSDTILEENPLEAQDEGVTE